MLRAHKPCRRVIVPRYLNDAVHEVECRPLWAAGEEVVAQEVAERETVHFTTTADWRSAARLRRRRQECWRR